MERLFCRSCQYELTGLTPGPDGLHACPECGRRFDPLDHRSFSDLPRHPFWLFVFSRRGAWCGVALLLIAAFQLSWLPRPLALDPTSSVSEWGLWVWFNREYGVRRSRGTLRELDVWYFAGEETSIVSREVDGPDDWRISLGDNGTMRVEVFRPGSQFRGLFSAMRALKTWPRYPVWFIARAPERSVLPVSVEGDWEHVAATLANHFDFELRGMLAYEGQDMIYILEKGADRARLVSVAEARSLGFDPQVVPASAGFRIRGPR